MCEYSSSPEQRTEQGMGMLMTGALVKGGRGLIISTQQQDFLQKKMKRSDVQNITSMCERVWYGDSPVVCEYLKKPPELALQEVLQCIYEMGLCFSQTGCFSSVYIFMVLDFQVMAQYMEYRPFAEHIVQLGSNWGDISVLIFLSYFILDFV